MNQNHTSKPESPVAEEPQGDLGQGHKTWTPDPGEQGISNRADDEIPVVPESDQAEDAAAFGDDEEDDDDADEDEEEEEEDETDV